MKRQVEEIERTQQVSDQRRSLSQRRASADLYLGSLIRGYRLEELLGHGTVTSLYRARTEELWVESEVIVTLLHIPETFSPPRQKRFLQRFLDEAEQLIQLRHHGLFPLFGYGEENGLPYLIIPVVSGTSLATHIRRQQRWSPSEVLTLLEPIANALTYLHSQGLIYQYLNPTNILLRNDESPQITGLHLAQMLCMADLEDEEEFTSNGNSYSHLRDIAGGILGAVAYLAPEVVRGEKADLRADVYSLGVILFEMLSGKPPFTILNFLEGDQKPDHKSALAEDIDFPPALELVARRALHHDPDQRFQTPEELIAACSKALAKQLSVSEQTGLLSGDQALPKPPENRWDARHPKHRVPNSGSVISKQVRQSPSAQSMQVSYRPELSQSTERDSRIATASDPLQQGEVAATLVEGGGLVTNLLRYMLANLPLPVQRIIIAIFNRAGEPEPEELYASRQQSITSSAATWGWLPVVALTGAIGILVTAYAFNVSRDNGTGLEIFFFLGLPLIVVPTIVRLILPIPSRFERVGLLCLLGFYVYLEKVIAAPLHFSDPDEFIHWRTAQDIMLTKHLFSQNSLLPVSPYYPGLEIVTNAFSTLSGLDIFYSSLVMLGVARLVVVLAFFIINERITKSARIASIATLIYMANPQFWLYDEAFVYGSLALPLALFIIFAMGPYQLISVGIQHARPFVSSVQHSVERYRGLTDNTRWIMLTVWCALGALSLTHHVTSFFLDGLLLGWALIDAIIHRTPLLQSAITKTAAIAFVISSVNALSPGNPVVSYLFLQNVKEVLSQLEHIIAGSAGARQLFSDGGGQALPMWVRLIILSSLVLPVPCIPFGWLCLWRRCRSSALAVTFGLLSLLYPVTQVLRFAPDGVNLAQRAEPFLFIPISFLLAIFIGQFWPMQRLYWKQMVLVTCMILLLLMGGEMMAANSAFVSLPGPYEVMASSRSIEPEGIQAAVWARSHLEPDSRMAADSINQLLMSTYGNQYVITPIADKIDISSVFLSPRLDSDELSLLHQVQAHYLVVDLRLTKSLPTVDGFYYTQMEHGAGQYTTPLDVKDLTKFSTIPQVNKVFDGGNIVIYDVGDLLNVS